MAKKTMIEGHHGGISKVTCRNGKNAMIRPLRHDSHQKEWSGHGNTGLGRSYAQVVASE